MTKLKVLVGCEFSGVVRDEFIKLGHNAISCDILPTEKPGPHIQDDILNVIEDDWDLGIFFPPCTYLCSSGLHWNKRRPERQHKTDEALIFVQKLWTCNIPKICIENPIGCLSSKMAKPTQIIHPYEFGEDASKATCLWLKNLPKLSKTEYFPPRIINGKKRWGESNRFRTKQIGAIRKTSNGKVSNVSRNC